MSWSKVSTWLECSETTNLCPSSGLSNDPKRWIRSETYNVLESFKGDMSMEAAGRHRDMHFCSALHPTCAMQRSLPEAHHISVFPRQHFSSFSSKRRNVSSDAEKWKKLDFYATFKISSHYTTQFIYFYFLCHFLLKSSPTSKAMTYTPSHKLEWVTHYILQVKRVSGSVVSDIRLEGCLLC